MKKLTEKQRWRMYLRMYRELTREYEQKLQALHLLHGDELIWDCDYCADWEAVERIILSAHKNKLLLIV